MRTRYLLGIVLPIILILLVLISEVAGVFQIVEPYLLVFLFSQGLKRDIERVDLISREKFDSGQEWIFSEKVTNMLPFSRPASVKRYLFCLHDIDTEEYRSTAIEEQVHFLDLQGNTFSPEIYDYSLGIPPFSSIFQNFSLSLSSLYDKRFDEIIVIPYSLLPRFDLFDFEYYQAYYDCSDISRRRGIRIPIERFCLEEGMRCQIEDDCCSGSCILLSSGNIGECISSYPFEELCHDSEAPMDIFSSGEVYLSGERRMYKERCMNEVLLFEHWCADGTINSRSFICTDGCVDGACVRPATGQGHENSSDQVIFWKSVTT